MIFSEEFAFPKQNCINSLFIYKIKKLFILVEPLIYKEDADRINQIHTLNAQYLIDTLPDRLYSHMTRADML